VTGREVRTGPAGASGHTPGGNTAQREDWRRALHAASALLGPLAFWLPGRGGTLTLSGLAGFALFLEAWRHASPAVHGLIASAGRPVFRPIEDRGVSGPTALACGYLLTWLLFEPAAAASAMVVAGLADPAAALLGRRFGNGQRKSAVGSAACAVTAAGVLAAAGAPASTIVAGGIVAALAERAPWRGADNVLVPLSVGLTIGMLGGP